MESIPVPNTFPHLFWGYTVIWVLLCVYIVSLGFRVSKLEKKTAASKERDNAD